MGRTCCLERCCSLVYAQHGAGNDAGDVFHIRSTDNGVTFSAPLSRLVQFLPFLPLLVAFTFSVLAEPPAQFDCTIRYWNEALQKERTHDYDTGYSTTKVAPSDIAWLQPGMSPVGRPGPSRSPHSRICCTQLVLEGQYHQQHRAPKYYDQVEVN